MDQLRDASGHTAWAIAGAERPSAASASRLRLLTEVEEEVDSDYKDCLLTCLIDWLCTDVL
jgi:hypothetical protein